MSGCHPCLTVRAPPFPTCRSSDLAGPADQARLDLAGLVALGGPALADGDGAELPLLAGEAGRVGQRLRLVVLVDEVGAVAAAALPELGGRPGEHPLAAPPADARPRAGEERAVEDPGAVLLRILDGHPFVHVYLIGSAARKENGGRPVERSVGA